MFRPNTTNELFHFTSKENLLGIIDNGFYPKYNFEYTFLSQYFDRPCSMIVVAMVSFCDIPPHLAEEHSNKYGKYGIGLNKEWGYKNLLNPIVYLPHSSKLSAAFAALANSFSGYIAQKGDSMKVVGMISQALKSSTDLGCFLKQYERQKEEVIVINGNRQVLPKGRFYDEREWRYVPFDKSINELLVIPASEFHKTEEINQENEKLQDYKLEFDLKDITHILYRVETDKAEIADVLSIRFKTKISELHNKIEFIQA